MRAARRDPAVRAHEPRETDRGGEDRFLLTFLIALENLRGRFNMALGVGAACFREGMVCTAPATSSQARLDL